MTRHELNLILKTEGAGATLRRGEAVQYETGYQVAVSGKTATTAESAEKIMRRYRNNCGLWTSEGICYINKSFHIKSRRLAFLIGKIFHQQSIYNWATGECEEVE